MSSQLPLTLDSGHSTPPSDDEVLVRVEGVSKKFCRSLKKSLWYGVCDIAGELLPGRKRRETMDERRELSERLAQNISRSPLDAGLSTAAASALDSGHSTLDSSCSAKALDARRSTLDSSCSAKALDSGPSPLDSSCSAKALDARPSTLDSSAPALASGRSTLDPAQGLRPGEFWAVKDVSFELRRGECLGLIGHNGAGKTTLLKMLNGLIKPDAGSITMRGRVGALIALGAGFNPILTGREPKGWEARRMSNRSLARRGQRRREGANQNIYINGSVLGLTKKEPERRAAQRKGAAGRPAGLRGSGEPRTKSTPRSTR